MIKLWHACKRKVWHRLPPCVRLAHQTSIFTDVYCPINKKNTLNCEMIQVQAAFSWSRTAVSVSVRSVLHSCYVQRRDKATHPTYSPLGLHKSCPAHCFEGRDQHRRFVTLMVFPPLNYKGEDSISCKRCCVKWLSSCNVRLFITTLYSSHCKHCRFWNDHISLTEGVY